MKKRSLASLFAAVLVLALAHPGNADNQLKSSTFGGLVARAIGPAVTGGRIADLTAVPGEPLTIYVGSAGGGVWRSKDGGLTFHPVFDKHSQSIGAVAVDPEQPQTVWVGTGEAWTRNTVSVGTGVYKSTDGGDSWKLMGLADSEHVARIVVDPSDSATVYVCALGHLWNSNEERGVFKTTDGGATWKKVLYVDADTGCSDLSQDPQDPDILYAGMWQVRRYPWSFDSGGPGSGLYRSTDGGATWKELANGLPEGNLGRIAVAVAPSRPSVVYAVVEAKEKTALYRSDDLGEHFAEMNSSFNVAVRPFYFARLVVDPEDYQRVYKPGLTLSVSKDGGASFTSPFSGDFSFGGVHPDHHALWIDPTDPHRLLLGTDGGVYESRDRGGHWRHIKDLPVSQLYHVACDTEYPFNVYGGLQDNGSWMGPSQAPGAIQNKNWSNVGFGDGFWAFPDPGDSSMVYSEYQGGTVSRIDRRTGEVKDIAPYPSADEPKYRYNWNTPFHPSPSGAFYLGAQFLFRSTDHGETWKKISPDLTSNDASKQKQEESGGLTIDNSTAENYATIYAVAESPKDSRVVWVGTDDGNLQLTRDGGASWSNVVANVPGVPGNTWVSYVAASPFDAGTAFVAFDGHRTGDMTPYAFTTTDYGATWKPLATGDVDGYVLCVRQDTKQPGLLYLGSERGLWISIDGGGSWARFTGLPPVAVRDMAIQPQAESLVLATHGRGVYIVDDLTPLRALTPEVMDADLSVLPAKPAVMVIQDQLQEFGSEDEFAAPNPPEAASIYYYLKKRHLFGDFKVQVFDQQGTLITELPAGLRVGINQVQWPMRLKPPKVAPGNSLVPAFEGPRVAEGTYSFKVVKGKKTYDGTVSLVPDPRSPHSAADRALQQKTAMALYNRLEDLSYVADALSDLRDQSRARAEAAGRSLRKKLTAYADELESLRGKLVATNPAGWLSGEERIREKLAALYGSVNAYEGRPTDAQLARYQVLDGELAHCTRELEALTTGTRLESLNRALHRASQEPLTPLDRAAWNAKRGGGGSGPAPRHWPGLGPWGVPLRR